MTFWDKVINQNKMDSSIISQLEESDKNHEEQKKIL